MSNIQVFRNPMLGIELRTIWRGDEALVSAEDLAEGLGYTRTANMISSLRDRHVVKVPRSELGLPPGNAIRYVTEAGLYRAAMGSRLPNAEEFQDWITDDVLPSIRKNGGYIMPELTLIQSIRLTEIKDYSTLRGILARASDYDKNPMRHIYPLIQDKFHEAVTGHTARELISTREIMQHRGKRGPRRRDLEVAKNYLEPGELTRLTGLTMKVIGEIKNLHPEEDYTVEQVVDIIVRVLND